MERVYTPATDRLRELHKNYGGSKSGNHDTAHWFDNGDVNDNTGNFYASSSATATTVYNGLGYKKLSEQEFIDFMQFDEDLLRHARYNLAKNNLLDEIPSEEKQEETEDPLNVDNVNSPSHYDNTNGSLYFIAEQRGWNAYQFDIIKRIDRSLKKGQFKEDLEKTKFLIDLWLKEIES